MTNEPELKNCPFCNHEESMQRVTGINPDNPPLFKAVCFNCMATITRLKRHEAVEAWNSRVIDDKYKKAIEFIKSLHGCAYSRSCIEQYNDAQLLLRELGEMNDRT